MNHLCAGITVLRDSDQTACKFSAEDLPVFRLPTTSKETFCPVEVSHPGALDCADVHESILAVVIRLDEDEAFLAFHGS
jgi:hypothetical protein